MADHALGEIVVRRATLRDFTDLIAVERDAFGRDAWPADAFAELLGRKSTAALVAWTPDDGVIGFIVYRRDPGGVMVVDIAVDRGYRRRLVASCLLQEVAGRFPHRGIGCVVPRRSSPIQACLRRNGFLCAKVLREEDAFVFYLDPLPPDGRGNAPRRRNPVPKSPAHARTA